MGLQKVFFLGRAFLLEINSYLHISNLRKKEYFSKKIKMGFCVFEPETWDKLQPVYDYMINCDLFEVEIIVIPSFNNNLKTCNHYGKEYRYFSERYENVIKAIDESTGKIISTKKYDYIFYQDPYNSHMPKGLKSYETSKYSKLCYIPYGLTYFYHIALNRDFFRDLYFCFTDSQMLCDNYHIKFSKFPSFKYQSYVYCGYPVIEKYLKLSQVNENKTIMWTPRWSYDSVVGGSHFLEYKDEFIELSMIFPKTSLIIRPHPMTFSNMIKEQYMTEEEVDKYKERLKDNNIILDEGNTVEEAFKETDILITDFSSINVMYFLTGKPIIFCPFFKKNDSIYDKLQEGMYIANSWGEIIKYLEQILCGNDYLLERRKQIKEELFSNYPNATNEVVKIIIEDFKSKHK